MNAQQKALQKAVKSAGGTSALARRLSDVLGREIKHYVVSKWAKARVPAEYCAAIEQVSGVAASDLRPDVFRPTPAEAA